MVGVVILFLLVGLAVTVILYVLIAEEPASTSVTDRSEAEKAAQRFGGVDNRKHKPRDNRAGADAGATHRAETNAESTHQTDEDGETRRGTNGENTADESWGYSRLDDERERG